MKKFTYLFLLLILSSFASTFAQQKTSGAQSGNISGIVTDEKGETIIRATIKVKGSQTGTVTDVNGKFTIKASPNATLLVTYVGYISQEIALNGRTAITVQLAEETKTLDEVVVVGYQTMKRRDLTGSVASVSGKTIATAPVANVAQAMQGKLSGVNIVTQDGRPDAAVSIRVRGGGSISQSNDPLILLDGVTVGSLSDIPSDQIESIDVLKDASSTAIYGARGANGVILITTKAAKEGKASVSYNSYVKFNTPEKYLNDMKPYDYLKYVWANAAAYGAAYQTPFEQLYGLGAYPGTNTGGLDSYRNMSADDMQKKVYNNSVTQNHNISISGGNDKTKIMLSANYMDDEGMKIQSFAKRTNVSLKVNQKLFDNVDVSLDTRYTDDLVKDNEGLASSNGSLLSYSYRFRPIATSNILGDLNALKTGNISSFGQAVLWDSYSPYARINSYDPNSISQSLLNTASLNWKIIKGLTYHTDLTLSRGWGQTKTWAGYVYQNYVNPATGAATFAGDATYRKSDSWGMRWSNTLTYELAISRIQKIKLLLGQEVTNSGGTYLQVAATKFPSNFTEDNAFAMINQYSSTGTLTVASATSVPNRINSYFGRADYSLLDRYMATITFRGDGSSIFSPLHRWGYFPAGALAWRASDEPLLKKLTWLDNLKVRVAYGSVGNNNIPANSWSQMFAAGTNITYMYPLNHTSTAYYDLASSAMANPDLKWETTITRNGGIDFSILKSRLSGTVEVYWNTTKDLLMQTTLPGITGFTSTYKNIGQTSNKGIEVSLSGTIFRNSDWNITANGNINFNKNNVDKLAPNISGLYGTNWASASTYPTYDYTLIEGQPVGLVRGFVYDGFYTTNDFTYANGIYTLKTGVPDLLTSAIGVVHGIGSGTADRPTGQVAYPGLPKFRDVNGDGKIDDKDVGIIGNMNPKHTGGFNLNISYRNIDLGAYFNWSYGNQIYNLTKLGTTFGPKEGGVYENKLAIMNNAYKIYDIVNGQMVRLTTPDQLNAANANASMPLATNETCPTSSLAIEDGSYLRLNTVTLGYTVPKNLLKKLKIDNIRIYASIYNVLTVTGYSGVDPEVNTNSAMSSSVTYPTTGLDWGTYPRARSYTIGINLNF